jgi:hypothetical protein
MVMQVKTAAVNLEEAGIHKQAATRLLQNWGLQVCNSILIPLGVSHTPYACFP